MVSGSEALENQSEENPVAGTSEDSQDQNVSCGGVGRSPSRSLLVLSFLAAFLFATGAVIAAGHLLVGAPRSLSLFNESPQPASSDLFSQPLVVAAPGIYQRVSARDELNPVRGSDFLVFVWFRLRKVPVAGESMSLLGKFDAHQPHKPGYAISLEGAPDGVRPRVYWNNESGQGRWYVFTSQPIKRKEWYLLGISYSRDTFLGAHLLQEGADSTATLLGGHRLEPPCTPSSSADMVVGAYGSSRFRGQLGPFGILRGASFEHEAPEYLTAMQKSPNEIPSSIPAELIQLWTSPMIDRGPHRVVVQTLMAKSVERPRVAKSAATSNAPKRSLSKRDKKSTKRNPRLSGKR